MELLRSKYASICSTLKKKTYDFTDHRISEFDSDFETFNNSIKELDVSYVSNY